MSAWTQIEGTVSIYKKDHISIKDVINDIFTDDSHIHLETEEFPEYYKHYIGCDVRVDGHTFMDRYEEFIKSLKPIKGTLDLECQIRLIN